MQGLYLSQQAHIVNITPPIDINGAGADSDVFSMANHAHATIIVQLGVTGATATVTVEECDNFTPSTSNAIAFDYYAETTAGGDTLGAKTTATTSGFTTSANDGVFYVIEIDAAQLTDGFPCLRVRVSDPSAATLYSAVAILSGSRYAGDQNATAIA